MMRTYIVTFEDGTEFPVTAPSKAALYQLAQESGWFARFGSIVDID